MRDGDTAEPVRLDHATLRGQPGASHTRYTVALSGATGAGWLDAYRTVCEESASSKSFPIDAGTLSISFTCANVEGPAMVFEMLERLEALLVLAERRHESWSASDPAVPAVPAVRRAAALTTAS